MLNFRLMVPHCTASAFLTHVHAILGAASPFRDPPPAAKVMVGRIGADKVGAQRHTLSPQLRDRQGLLTRKTWSPRSGDYTGKTTYASSTSRETSAHMH